MKRELGQGPWSIGIEITGQRDNFLDFSTTNYLFVCIGTSRMATFPVLQPCEVDSAGVTWKMSQVEVGASPSGSLLKRRRRGGWQASRDEKEFKIQMCPKIRMSAS